MFFETTIMGNTADLAMVQKTVTDTLHKEVKSQRVITERGGCSRSAVSKHIKCKVDWKEEIALENVHKQEWRETESMLLEVQCEVSTVSDDLGCHEVCWCWSIVFYQVHSQPSHVPGNFRALHASFCWQALWRCWFHFPAGLGTCPHCQRYQKLVQWPWCYCAWLASKLAWPEPHIENLWDIQEEDERHQTQQCRWPKGRYQSNLGFHYTWAVPQTNHLHATPDWCSNSCKRRPNQVLSV